MDDDGSTTYCNMNTYCNMTTYCRTMISSLSSFLPVLDSWLPVVRQCRFFSDSFSKVVSAFSSFCKDHYLIICFFISVYAVIVLARPTVYIQCICTSTRREPRVYLWLLVEGRHTIWHTESQSPHFINSAYLCPSSATKACFVTQNESHITLRLLCLTSGCAGARSL